ncbi:MAG: helicase-exonuclease AddAB subunit AddA [Clostridiales bacterium]|nr:helicase-exonuclease AddAB subunit AddA [Clostridiales bacterium]
MPEWTDRQRAAIESRGQDLLVSAAAGSGKTAVMVERVKQLILRDRVPLSSILVMTFTNAAAAEMRMRIIETLESAQEQAGDADGFLREQLHTIDEAWICTLHSFCSRLLRRYYPVAGVDPGFRLLDEDEAAILEIAAMDDALSAAYESMPPGFDLLADAFGGRDGLALATQVSRLYRFAMSRAEGLGWLDGALGALRADEDALRDSAWIAELLRDAGEKAADAGACFEAALRMCEARGGPKGYRDTFAHDIEGAHRLIDASQEGYAAFDTALDAHAFVRLKSRGKDDDRDLADAIKDIRDAGKGIISKLKDTWQNMSLPLAAESIARMEPALSALTALTRDFAARYAAEKSARSALDFSDLEQYALRVVDDESAAGELRGQFEAVFIDEYQDINPVQERLITAVSRPGRLFCVGDVKQSIYRFRQAEPALFERRYRQSSPEELSLRRRIDMNCNFRSHPGILAGINEIFARIMSPGMGGVDYDESAALQPGAARPDEESDEPALEFVMLTGEAADDDSPAAGEDDAPDGDAYDDLTQRAVWEREAIYAAQRILSLVGKPIWDGKKRCMRPARWRDFAILMRTVRGRAHEVAAALESRGIPVFADAAAGFFDRVEVSWLMAALELTDNRWRDVPMIAALRSPIAGLTLSELIAIRSAGQDEPGFAAAVFAYAKREDDPLAARVRRFLAMLDAWKTAARHLRVDELMQRILEDTGLSDIVGAMPGGDLRQGNLRILIDRARSLSDTPARGLYGFLRHIGHLREHSMDPGEARPLSERDDVVRITSVHKSKGLEYPVVLVLGMGHRANMQDCRQQLLFHGELGFGFHDYDIEQKIRRGTLTRTAVQCRLERETLSETIRVLYVALTRARERLILIGSCKSDDRIRDWALPVAPALIEQGKLASPLDWVGATLLRHPSGRALRQRIGYPPAVEGGYARWSIEITHSAAADPDAPGAPRSAGEMLIRALNSAPDPAAAAAFAWEDPRAAATRLPAKTSATALVERIRPGETPVPEVRPRPQFMEQAPAPDPALRGTLVHTALRFITADAPDEQIARELERLEQCGILPPGGAAEVPPGKIRAFLLGDMGRRAAAARRVLREAPFVLSVPAGELYPELTQGGDEPILVQGILDLAFEEEDGWVLVDYKTNRVDDRQTPEALLSHYAPQLMVYRRALEELTGRPVKAAGLYLIAIDSMVFLSGDETNASW